MLRASLIHKQELTQAQLKELLWYNPCTGHFHWRTKPGFVRAGSVDRHGYRRIKIGVKNYRAARLAWLYIYGNHPQIIDHVNGVTLNDSIWNLANGTQADNMKNSTVRRITLRVTPERNARRKRAGGTVQLSPATSKGGEMAGCHAFPNGGCRIYKDGSCRCSAKEVQMQESKLDVVSDCRDTIETLCQLTDHTSLLLPTLDRISKYDLNKLNMLLTEVKDRLQRLKAVA